jgi:hypothetical protein
MFTVSVFQCAARRSRRRISRSSFREKVWSVLFLLAVVFDVFLLLTHLKHSGWHKDCYDSTKVQKTVTSSLNNTENCPRKNDWLFMVCCSSLLCFSVCSKEISAKDQSIIISGKGVCVECFVSFGCGFVALVVFSCIGYVFIL